VLWDDENRLGRPLLKVCGPSLDPRDQADAAFVVSDLDGTPTRARRVRLQTRRSDSLQLQACASLVAGCD
jgi:hypothetical protein